MSLSGEDHLGRLGVVPLPPYIHHRLEEPERYQTVYARDTGSAAAPTAGLHFTQPLLDRLKDSGVELVFLTLHVGLDTFRPVPLAPPPSTKPAAEGEAAEGEAAEETSP